MSPSSSLSSTPARERSVSERPRARSRFRPFRLFIFLLIIAVAALFEPNTFRFVAAQFIRFEAWRCGVSAQIGSMGGSMMEPLVIRKSVWIYESDTGPVTRVEVAEATAVFSWRNLLPRSTGPWFQRLSIQGLTGKIQFPLEAVEAPAAFGNFDWRLPRPGGLLFPSPERIEANAVDFIFQSNADYVRLADTQFMLSKVEGGTIRAGQLVIKQPWLDRTFRDVRGTTAIQDAVRGTASVPNARVVLANLPLAPEVQVRSFSADLDDLARGQLNLSLRLDAFGGDIQVDARTLSSQRPFSFESSANFAQINIGKLANFLGMSEAAGGTIKQGTFKFRGPPQQIPKATASLRLEATNFQWESRQWDALVLGATLMNGRVQVPELALAQGHNRLNLNGEMPLPTAGLEWWQSEFSVNIAAKIDNLTELSALMLPEFQFAAGKANIDGSIRAKDQQFNGQLIVSGSNLRWHNAPIEELHAGVKLNGNEFQLTNISLFNNGDYLRGHGVVNIIGDKQYWGEVHASIEDLDKYAALLEKPIVPEPLAGGAVIDWSGEGSAKGHSGKFSARLRKLRSLGTTAALLHPINADLDGNYAPGSMQFSRFMLSDDDSSFTANVGVGNKALSLQGIKLYHRQALWLEGDALLPLDVWNAWPSTTLDKLLDDQTVSKVNLTAYNLGLHDATLLTGWKFPIDGVVTGNLVAEGPLTSLKTSGKVALSKANIPLGWSGEILTNVDGEATVDGQALQLKKLTAQHASGTYSASGQVDFTNLRNPNLQLSVTSPDAVLRLFADETRTAITHLGGAIKVTGPLSTAAITGDLRLLAMALQPSAPVSKAAAPIDYSPLILGAGTPPLPSPLSVKTPPWSNWSIDTVLKTATPITVPGLFSGSRGSENNQSVVEADLRLLGPARSPGFVGTAKLRGGRMAIGAGGELRLKDATVNFREGYPWAPSIDGEAEGSAFGEAFAVQITGTLPHPMRTYEFAPPLTEKIIVESFSAAPSKIDTAIDLALLVPDGLYEDVVLADWPVIATPPPAPVPAPAAPAPATPAGTTAPPAATAPAAPTVPAPMPAAAAPAVPVPAPAAPTAPVVPAPAAPVAPAPAAPAALAPAAPAAPAISNTPTTPAPPVPPAALPPTPAPPRAPQ